MFGIPPSAQDPRTFAIIGAAYEVHRVLGTGFLEILYKDALEIEFNERQVPFQREAPCLVEYKGRPLRRDYHVDFICFGEIILEIKAVVKLDDVHRAQVHNYLKSTGYKLGLLVNFGHHPLLEHERIVR